MNTPEKQPLSERNLPGSPCPECSAPRLKLERAVELWINNRHADPDDPYALVCPQCGYISFYATPATLMQIQKRVNNKR